MTSVRVAIAGSSGSIGTQTLEVVAAEAGDYEVVALGAASSVDPVSYTHLTLPTSDLV